MTKMSYLSSIQEHLHCCSVGFQESLGLLITTATSSSKRHGLFLLLVVQNWYCTNQSTVRDELRMYMCTYTQKYTHIQRPMYITLKRNRLSGWTTKICHMCVCVFYMYNKTWTTEQNLGEQKTEAFYCRNKNRLSTAVCEFLSICPCVCLSLRRYGYMFVCMNSILRCLVQSYSQAFLIVLKPICYLYKYSFFLVEYMIRVSL